MKQKEMKKLIAWRLLYDSRKVALLLQYGAALFVCARFYPIFRETLGQWLYDTQAIPKENSIDIISLITMYSIVIYSGFSILFFMSQYKNPGKIVGWLFVPYQLFTLFTGSWLVGFAPSWTNSEWMTIIVWFLTYIWLALQPFFINRIKNGIFQNVLQESHTKYSDYRNTLVDFQGLSSEELVPISDRWRPYLKNMKVEIIQVKQAYDSNPIFHDSQGVTIAFQDPSDVDYLKLKFTCQAKGVQFHDQTQWVCYGNVYRCPTGDMIIEFEPKKGRN
ncbi:hypothetical protein [Listeria goaensis]|uniref:hypothetical protein n=1 Tax=Listeria goaensis TaxID=1649188 RepID=UPI0013564F29|nr:hypothetical protein [Listeria goaensis]